MNPSSHNQTDAIRSDIDETRRRMDDTMDALGDRMQPRHLLDELLGFLRGDARDGDSRMSHLRDKLTRSCDTAMHSVVDSVKQNPVPVLVIGAGVAWMIYASRREKPGRYDAGEYARYRAQPNQDPDSYLDQPLEYPTGVEFEAGGSKFGEVKDQLADKASSAAGRAKDKLARAGEAAREKLSHAGDAAKEKVQAFRERAGEVTAQVRDKTKEAYEHTRERVVETADQHPLEVGLVALAAGLIAGLVLPTPNAVNRTVGPAADRLRDRTREAGADMVRKGRRVAEAAVNAVKDEAQAQGLTPERLREKASALAERAQEAGSEAAKREGLKPAGEPDRENESNAAPTPSNPSVARPAV